MSGRNRRTPHYAHANGCPPLLSYTHSQDRRLHRMPSAPPRGRERKNFPHTGKVTKQRSSGFWETVFPLKRRMEKVCFLWAAASVFRRCCSLQSNCMKNRRRENKRMSGRNRRTRRYRSLRDTGITTCFCRKIWGNTVRFILQRMGTRRRPRQRGMPPCHVRGTGTVEGSLSRPV